MMRRNPFDSSAAAPAFTDPVEAALALRSAGRLVDALELLRRTDASSPDAWNLRADLQFELGQFSEAVQSYEAAIGAGPDNVRALQNLALCHYQLQQWEEAAAAYREVLAYESHRDDARLGLGGCLLHLHRSEEALTCFEQCWSKAARARAEFGKGTALQLLRQFDRAEAAYERALTADPKMGEALSNLIAMSMEVFDLSRVHRYALRLADSAPRSRIALQALTLVALERREFDDAAHYFARYLDQAPPQPEPVDEEPGDRPVEYRLSHEVVARLNQILGQRRTRVTRVDGRRF